MAASPLERVLLSDPARVLAACVAEEARRSGSRSFAAFVKQAWHLIPEAEPLEWSPYLDGLCKALEAASRRKLRRLLVNGPPRQGKSNVFAILWVAWVWTWNPKETFLFLSFSQRLVTEHTSRCRDVVMSEWYQQTYRPAWTLRTDRQDEIENTAGGRRISITMAGSGATGRGGNVICFDDPLSADDANSAAERATATRVVEQVVSSRFNNSATGVAVINMQRVHWDDPSKWAISRGWTHMLCPLVKDERECIVRDDDGAEVWRDARAVGEVLVPARNPPRDVEEKRLNAMLFATQFQQQPIEHVNAGMYFQRGWFEGKKFDVPPMDVAAVVRSWDLASTEGGGDWTVGVKLARLHDGRFVVLNVIRGQWSPFDVRKEVCAAADSDGWDCPIILPQDPGQAGKDQVYEYTVKLAGYTISSPRPTGSKEVRAGGASSQAKAGNLWLVRAPWNEPFLQALEAFPDPAVHDDDVDALSEAMTHLAQKEKTQAEMWEEMDIES
jgi:predicted phage terminase large subunit-like protein